jgi:hypothetical protein
MEIVLNRYDLLEDGIQATVGLQRTELLVAVDEGEVMASAFLVEREGMKNHWDLSLSGEGSALVEVARSARLWAFECEATSLEVAEGVSEGSDFARSLEEAGFESGTKLVRFEMELDPDNLLYTPLLARMMEKGKIPEEGRLIDFPELSLNSARELLRRRIMQSRGRLYELDAVREFSPELSFGIGDGQQLAAVVLATMIDGHAHINWAAVDDGYQGSWAYVMFQAEIEKRILEHSAGPYLYETNPELDSGFFRVSKNNMVRQLETVVRYHTLRTGSES